LKNGITRDILNMDMRLVGFYTGMNRGTDVAPKRETVKTRYWDYAALIPRLAIVRFC
jgi:hypothetical protein